MKLCGQYTESQKEYIEAELKDTSYWSIEGAIKRLNKLCATDENCNYKRAEWLGITNIEAIKTVLSYIEKVECVTEPCLVELAISCREFKLKEINIRKGNIK